MNTKEAQVISYVTTLADRELNEYEIDTLTNRVREVRMPNAAIANEIDALLNAVKKNLFIEAVKCYRAMTGLGLKESKDAIERYRVNINHPESV